MSRARGGLLVTAAAVAGTAVVAAVVARREEAGVRVAFGDGDRPRPDDVSGAAPLPDRSRDRVGLGTGRLVAPSWEPAALTALARWVPSPPTTPWGRALVRGWAAPLTGVGLVLAAASGVRPRRHGDVWVAAPAGGVFAARFARRGFVACTLGHVIVAAREPDERLLAHERVHVRQAERLGPLMAPLYLGLMAVYGYARHPLERAARTGGR